MHIEQALIERLGDVGRKLHTGRSRNDQVSTATRLWVRDAMDRVDQRLVGAAAGVCQSLRSRCGRDPARPIRICSVLNPSLRRTTGWRIARSSSAIVSGWRIAGAASMRARWAPPPWPAARLPIDRENVARRLGFETILANSLDASSDRDFVLEPLFVLSRDRLSFEHVGGGVDPVVDGRIRVSETAAGSSAPARRSCRRR